MRAPLSRIIRYGFFINEDLCECSPLARLAFIGLWLYADREGLIEDRPKKLKIALLPTDNCDFNDLLNELAKVGVIERLGSGKAGIIRIPSFKKQQGKAVHWNERQSELIEREQVGLLGPNKPLQGDNSKYKYKQKCKQKKKVELKEVDDCRAEDALAHFHYICKSLPKVTELTSSRRSVLLARLKDLKKRDQNEVEFFDYVEANNFLTGRKTDWIATFDWILKKQNFIKIIEGHYDRDDSRKKGKPKNAQRKRHRDSGSTAI